MKIIKTACVVVAAGLLALTGCASGSPNAADNGSSPTVKEDLEFEAGTTMAKLNEAGKIRVGTKYDQPLFGLKNPQTNKPEGFDIEIAKIVAAELGIPEDNIEWKETVAANREPFLQNGEVDIVIATYSINDKRKAVVDFAGPYYVAGQDLLVLQGNPEGLTGAESIKDKKVCSVVGSVSEEEARKAGAEVLAADTYTNCLEPLRSGQVVAVTTDGAILAGLVDQNPGEFEIVDNPFTEEPYGIGLKKGDDAFRQFLNQVIEDSYASGEWEAAWERTAGKALGVPVHPKVDKY